MVRPSMAAATRNRRAASTLTRAVMGSTGTSGFFGGTRSPHIFSLGIRFHLSTLQRYKVMYQFFAFATFKGFVLGLSKMPSFGASLRMDSTRAVGAR